MKITLFLLLSTFLIYQPVNAENCIRLVNNNELDAAKICLLAKPPTVKRLTALGYIETLKHNHTKALKYYRKAYDMEPDRSDLMYSYGVALINASTRKGRAIGKILDLNY